MNKLTIALLSMLLPMAAQADQWICESTHVAVVSSRTNSLQSSGENRGARLIVDTDKGFKIPDPFGTGVASDNPFAPDYEGTCSVFNTKFITRQDIAAVNDAAMVTSILLDTFEGVYSYSLTIAQRTATVESHVGKCTKL